MDWIFEQIKVAIESNQFLQGGVVLGLLTGLLYKLQSWPLTIWNKIRQFLVYEVYFDDTTEFYDEFAEWLKEKHPTKLRRVEVKIQDGVRGEATQVPSGYYKPAKPSLQFTQFTDRNILRYGRRLLVVSKERVVGQGLYKRERVTNTYTVYGLFAKKAIQALCAEVLLRHQDKVKPDGLRLYIYGMHGFRSRIVDAVKPFEHLFFKGKAELLADIERFLLRREKYIGLGMNVKYGYLFYGVPGTGKTSAALALAVHLQRPVYVINLANISESDFQSIGGDIEKGSVVLFEDIDCVMSGRKSKDSKVNFATILNFLDGVYSPSDVIFVMTTNKPEALDDAMLRKGRIDFSLEIGHATGSEIAEFVSDFYQVDNMPTALNGLSMPMCEVQDICLRSETLEDAVRKLQDGVRLNGHKTRAHKTA